MADISATINDDARLEGDIQESASMTGDMSPVSYIDGEIVGARGPKGEPGTTVYSELTDKPQIEGVTLDGNQTFEELNLAGLTNRELEEMLL